MNIRQRLLVTAAVPALLLTGCGGNTDEPAPQPAPSAQASATPKSEAEYWSESLCSGVDKKKLAAVFEAEVAVKGGAGQSQIGIPTYDTCTTQVIDGARGTNVVYGWSAGKVSDADWKTIKKYAKDGNGRYTKIIPIDVGSGGYVANRVAVAHVGDRVINVLFTGASAKPKQLSAALKLAVPDVPKLPVYPAKRTLKACDGATKLAEKVMGTKATIRRDSIHQNLPHCGWAAPMAAVEVDAVKQDGAESFLKDNITSFGGKKVDGLGKLAAYFGGEDSHSVQFVSDKGNTVMVLVPALLPGDKDALIALAKKVAPNY